MRGRKQSTAWWVWVLLFVLAVVFFCLSFLILMVVDKHYAGLRAILICFLKTDNHFDGDLWFSAAATFIGALISAVPGLMCGLLAYIQTERLHELEDRFHRPVLELEEAKTSIIMLRNKEGELRKSSKEIIDGLPWAHYRFRQTVEEAIENKHLFYIVLKIDFHVKNEITVKRILIRQVNFLIGKETLHWVPSGEGKKSEEGRHKIWELNKQIEQGVTKYTLEWILYPFEKELTDEFWRIMRDFILYTGIRNPEARYLELNVQMDVEYEYGSRDGAECMLCVEFDADTMHQVAMVQENCSCNGYFTYEVKQKKKYFLTRKKICKGGLGVYR